jgi:hypothetical protein
MFKMWRRKKMKTPQQIKNEVEKGCGKVTNWYELKRLCGTFEDLKHSEHTILCPSCLAKLSILTEYDKSIKEMILKLSITQNKEVPIIIEEGTEFIFTKELLSKIGDVQQSKEKRE